MVLACTALLCQEPAVMAHCDLVVPLYSLSLQVPYVTDPNWLTIWHTNVNLQQQDGQVRR